MLVDVVLMGGEHPYSTILAIAVLVAGTVWNGTG